MDHTIKKNSFKSMQTVTQQYSKSLVSLYYHLAYMIPGFSSISLSFKVRVRWRADRGPRLISILYNKRQRGSISPGRLFFLTKQELSAEEIAKQIGNELATKLCNGLIIVGQLYQERDKALLEIGVEQRVVWVAGSNC